MEREQLVAAMAALTTAREDFLLADDLCQDKWGRSIFSFNLEEIPGIAAWWLSRLAHSEVIWDAETENGVALHTERTLELEAHLVELGMCGPMEHQSLLTELQAVEWARKLI